MVCCFVVKRFSVHQLPHQFTISRLGRYSGSTEYGVKGAAMLSGKQATRGMSSIGGRVITISKVLVLRFEAPLFFANCRTCHGGSLVNFS